jgi:hypothetical protein
MFVDAILDSKEAGDQFGRALFRNSGPNTPIRRALQDIAAADPLTGTIKSEFAQRIAGALDDAIEAQGSSGIVGRFIDLKSEITWDEARAVVRRAAEARGIPKEAVEKALSIAKTEIAADKLTRPQVRSIIVGAAGIQGEIENTSAIITKTLGGRITKAELPLQEKLRAAMTKGPRAGHPPPMTAGQLRDIYFEQVGRPRRPQDVARLIGEQEGLKESLGFAERLRAELSGEAVDPKTRQVMADQLREAVPYGYTPKPTVLVDRLGNILGSRGREVPRSTALAIRDESLQRLRGEFLGGQQGYQLRPQSLSETSEALGRVAPRVAAGGTVGVSGSLPGVPPPYRVVPPSQGFLGRLAGRLRRGGGTGWGKILLGGLAGEAAFLGLTEGGEVLETITGGAIRSRRSKQKATTHDILRLQAQRLFDEQRTQIAQERIMQSQRIPGFSVMEGAGDLAPGSSLL